jgi:hypothetical protein
MPNRRASALPLESWQYSQGRVLNAMGASEPVANGVCHMMSYDWCKSNLAGVAPKASHFEDPANMARLMSHQRAYSDGFDATTDSRRNAGDHDRADYRRTPTTPYVRRFTGHGTTLSNRTRIAEPTTLAGQASHRVAGDVDGNWIHMLGAADGLTVEPRRQGNFFDNDLAAAVDAVPPGHAAVLSIPGHTIAYAKRENGAGLLFDPNTGQHVVGGGADVASYVKRNNPGGDWLSSQLPARIPDDQSWQMHALSGEPRDKQSYVSRQIEPSVGHAPIDSDL